MAGLGHPVVGAHTQAAHALGDGRRAGADDHGQGGRLARHAFEVLPREGTEQREVEYERSEAHGDEPVDGHGGGQHAVPASHAVQPFGQHLDEALSPSRIATYTGAP
jgi:hypothetical protein